MTRTRKRDFSWGEVTIRKAPSQRYCPTGWAYAEKVWIFGGYGPSPTAFGHLNDCADFLPSRHYGNQGFNNQLICFDPTNQEWTNVNCSGTVPSPRYRHSSTINQDKVWLYGGLNGGGTRLNDLYELKMPNFTWTLILMPQPIQKLNSACSLNGIADNQLVFHGINDIMTDGTTVTWILDFSSLSWRKHTVTVDHYRSGHTGTTGLNNSVIIVGGNVMKCRQKLHISTFVTRLAPKSLQQLAMRTVYDHRAVLPWKLLPK